MTVCDNVERNCNVTFIVPAGSRQNKATESLDWLWSCFFGEYTKYHWFFVDLHFKYVLPNHIYMCVNHCDLSFNFSILFLAVRDHKQKIFFEEPRKTGVLAYDGVPFTIHSRIVLECHHGRDRHVVQKKKNQEAQVLVWWNTHDLQYLFFQLTWSSSSVPYFIACCAHKRRLLRL